MKNFIFVLLFAFCFASVCSADDDPILHCYISSGDNQWLGQSLPIDSPTSIDASIDLLHAIPEIDDHADYQVSLKVFRKDKRSTIVVQVRGPNGGGKQELSLHVTEDGGLRMRDEIAEKWIPSGLTIEPRKWTNITITASRRTRTYSITIKSENKPEQLSKTNAPLNVQSDVRIITLFPQPPEGSVTLVDDIALTEVR